MPPGKLFFPAAVPTRMYEDGTDRRKRGTAAMLLVQDACLFWGKRERASPYAGMRAEFPRAFLMEKVPDAHCGNILVHNLHFWQKGRAFQVLQMNEAYRFQCYSSASDLSLTNLSLQFEEDRYAVTFFYDERRSGRPVRRGHNQDYWNEHSAFCCRDILNETAFSLKQGQYGRVLWNERKLDQDTGEWYYRLHIVNFLAAPEKTPEPDVFLTRSPDFVYQQMAVLY